MTTLRKKTQLLRATLTTQLAMILGPETHEADVGPGAIRCVQILTPPGPLCHFELDQPPVAVGPGRDYNVPQFPANQVVKFYLLPDQFLVGMCGSGEGGTAMVSLVVEYFDEDQQQG